MLEHTMHEKNRLVGYSLGSAVWFLRFGYVQDYVVYTIWHLLYKYTLLRWYEARLICH
jgi:hypothetical protein